MSLRYRLFGIPANVDEVVERAQRTGEIPESYATRTQVGTLVPDCQIFKYKVGVKIGRTKVPVHQWERSFNHFVKGLDDDRPDFVVADHCAHEKAEEVASELSQEGIPVFYNGEIYCSPKNSEPTRSLSLVQ